MNRTPGVLDHKWYPHLIDEILFFSTWDVLKTFRETSKTFLLKANANLVHHVIVGGGPRHIEIRAPGGVKIPGIGTVVSGDAPASSTDDSTDTEDKGKPIEVDAAAIDFLARHVRVADVMGTLPAHLDKHLKFPNLHALRLVTEQDRGPAFTYASPLVVIFDNRFSITAPPPESGVPTARGFEPTPRQKVIVVRDDIFPLTSGTKSLLLRESADYDDLNVVSLSNADDGGESVTRKAMAGKMIPEVSDFIVAKPDSNITFVGLSFDLKKDLASVSATLENGGPQNPRVRELYDLLKVSDVIKNEGNELKAMLKNTTFATLDDFQKSNPMYLLHRPKTTSFIGYDDWYGDGALDDITDLDSLGEVDDEDNEGLDDMFFAVVDGTHGVQDAGEDDDDEDDDDGDDDDDDEDDEDDDDTATYLNFTGDTGGGGAITAADLWG